MPGTYWFQADAIQHKYQMQKAALLQHTEQLLQVEQRLAGQQLRKLLFWHCLTNWGNIRHFERINMHKFFDKYAEYLKISLEREAQKILELTFSYKVLLSKF